jgi:hypothetical protein
MESRHMRRLLVFTHGRLAHSRVWLTPRLSSPRREAALYPLGFHGLPLSPLAGVRVVTGWDVARRSLRVGEPSRADVLPRSQ